MQGYMTTDQANTAVAIAHALHVKAHVERNRISGDCSIVVMYRHGRRVECWNIISATNTMVDSAVVKE